jgi:hypothetical protein
MYLRRFFGDGIDPDAEAFIIAAGINKPIQEAAINDLVIGLKADGLWTKMKAIYPFVGGTATAHKFNLKDPRDLDAAFRLVFFGGWTHDINGSQPNGTNGYADTKLNVSTQLSLNNTHISIYSRTNAQGLFCDIGGNLALPALNIFPNFNGDAYFRVNDGGGGTAANTNTLGLFMANRISSTESRNRINGVLKIVTANSTSLQNSNLFLGKGELNSFYSPRQQAFASIGNGLTDTEAANLYTRVQAFQTALSRQV